MRSKDVAAVAIAMVTACSLTTDFNGLSSGGVGGPDGSSSSSGGGPNDGSTIGTFDAGPDATKVEPLPTGGVVIAPGVSPYAAGAAQQHHVHFAANLGAYVIFYLSPQAKNELRTRITPDFATFVDGPSLPLPHPHDNEGRNFDVAYANIGGADIFHLVISIHDGSRYSFRARGRATKDSALKFDAASELDHVDSNYPAQDPDGPSVTMLATGAVIMSTGYNNVGGHTSNAVVWMASKNDDGAPDWDHSFAPGNELATADKSVNARQLVGYLTGAALTWEHGDQEPRPTKLDYSIYDGATWSPPAAVPFALTMFDVADWNEAVTTDGHLHILRFANGVFEYQSADQNGPTMNPPPAAIELSPEDGVVTLVQFASLSVFALAKSDHALKRTTLDGNAWSAWSDVAPADGQRSHLSGNGDVIMWQRGTDLVGLRLSP